jgi:hypothetical protein
MEGDITESFLILMFDYALIRAYIINKEYKQERNKYIISKKSLV